MGGDPLDDFSKQDSVLVQREKRFAPCTHKFFFIFLVSEKERKKTRKVHIGELNQRPFQDDAIMSRR